MSDNHYTQDDFETLFFDINGLTAKEWDELRELYRTLLTQNMFDSDAFKCAVGSVVLYISQGKGLREDDLGDPENDWVN